MAPLVELASNERLCPRCGSPLLTDRRVSERRTQTRRRVNSRSLFRRERRVAERRTSQRRAATPDYGPDSFAAARLRWRTAQRPPAEGYDEAVDRQLP